MGTAIGHAARAAKQVRGAVEEAFLDGTIYFRANPYRPRELGGSFATALGAMATRALPGLYPHFTEIAVTETELAQLLEPTLSGPSTKFLESGLCILSLDAGRYVATCAGSDVRRIRRSRRCEMDCDSGGTASSMSTCHASSIPSGTIG